MKLEAVLKKRRARHRKKRSGHGGRGVLEKTINYFDHERRKRHNKSKEGNWKNNLAHRCSLQKKQTTCPKEKEKSQHHYRQRLLLDGMPSRAGGGPIAGQRSRRRQSRQSRPGTEGFSLGRNSLLLQPNQIKTDAWNERNVRK